MSGDIIMADPPVVAMNGHSQLGQKNTSDHVMKDSSDSASDETLNKDAVMAGSDSDNSQGEGAASSPDEAVPNGTHQPSPQHQRKGSSLSSPHLQKTSPNKSAISSPSRYRQNRDSTSSQQLAESSDEPTAYSHSRLSSPKDQRNGSSISVVLSPTSQRKAPSSAEHRPEASPTAKERPSQPSTLPPSNDQNTLANSPSTERRTSIAVVFDKGNIEEHTKGLATASSSTSYQPTSTAYNTQSASNAPSTMSENTSPGRSRKYGSNGLPSRSSLSAPDMSSGSVSQTVSASSVTRMLSTVSHTQLLKWVPPAVIDRVVADRIKKMDAISLVRHLAEGHRLGYKSDDILDEDIEWVRPNMSSRGLSSEPEILDVVARPQLNVPRPPPPSQVQDPLLIQQERALAEQQRIIAQHRTGPVPNCPHCGVSFPSYDGYAYHLSKGRCQEQPPAGGYRWSCEICMQGFTTKGGYEYHTKTKCCTKPMTIPAYGRSAAVMAKIRGEGQPAPILPPGQVHRGQEPPAILPPNAAYAQQFPPQARPEGPRPLHPAERPPMRINRANEPAPPPLINVSNPIRMGDLPPRPVNRSASSDKRSSIGSNIRRYETDLSPAELSALNAELDEAQRKYEADIADANGTYANDEAALEKRLTSLKNAVNTKKSVIRKKHGVTLRMRQSEKDLRAGALKLIERANGTPQGGSPISFSPINGPVNGSGGSGKRKPGRPPKNPASFLAERYEGSPSQRVHTSPYVSNHGLPAPITRQPPPIGSFAHPGPGSSQTNKRRNNEHDHSSPRPNGPNQGLTRSPWLTNPNNNGQNRNSSAPGLAMMEMRSEDAASKYKSRQPSNATASSQPKRASLPDSKGKAKVVIELEDSDSETDDDIPRFAPAKVQEEVLASVENDEDMEDAGEEEAEEEEAEEPGEE